ncbi:PREDICTED: pentatricopeptide repeat-containing protein At2g29760, chloroplastic-like [Ipomoea nil]|uniref:pentatricopeptide repeat-containing protein At2g29760, chloroplastic-like n=1 Tax=Ipomoea nil TaxID=35883 RepID=UPI000901FF79|nr:PREDICTED: pentatricopeptide repeat-containing protein At2g29760, chloroplastic-like [Ipomoea nil]
MIDGCGGEENGVEWKSEDLTVLAIRGNQREVKLEEEGERRLATLIQRCPNLRVLHQIHGHVLTCPLLSTSSLSFLLAKILTFAALSSRGSLGYAKQLVSRIPNPGIYSYNSLIRGFLESQTSSPEPIFIFKRLLRKNYPRSNTFNKHVVQSGHGSSPFVQTSLLNFYAKCEEIELSEKVFDEITERNVVAWSAMISGYSRLGMANQALDSFREMQKAGISPDRVTLVSATSQEGN